MACSTTSLEPRITARSPSTLPSNLARTPSSLPSRSRTKSAPPCRCSHQKYSALELPPRRFRPRSFSSSRAQPDGSLLRLRDVGRADLGSQDYSSFSYWNRKQAGFIIVYLSPGANAVDTQKQVVKFMEEAKRRFPPDLVYNIPYDSTRFVT